MKNALLIGVLVFSVVLNVAVATTLVWHVWVADAVAPVDMIGPAPLTESEARNIRAQWQEGAGFERIIATREQILQKNAEIIDRLTQNPSDPQVAEKELSELIALRGLIERQAIERIRQTMLTMPEEKRKDFALFLKSRACMGRGMGLGRGCRNQFRRGMGHGMGRGMHRGPAGNPPPAGY